MKHICIVTNKYPTSVDPTALTFVQQLAWMMRDMGKKISIICPLAVNLEPKFLRFPKRTEEKTYAGNDVKLYFPKYISLGQQKIGFVNTSAATTAMFTAAVRKALVHMAEKPDVLYGHFITPAGLAVCELGDELKLPSFVAYGESVPWSIDNIGRDKVKQKMRNVTGIISVSGKNAQDLVDIGVVEKEKIGVFPNGYIPSRFSPRDKQESRKMFGIPQDAFVVGFVGHYIERKGIGILKQAMDQIPDAYMICAGKGALKPQGDNVLHTDPVHPDKLAYFYSAADVFALPTLNEGCCNAIVEAIACGKPIVSSDLSFNDDLLDESNSIRIDPKNVNQIAAAIRRLKEDEELRSGLSQGSLRKAESLTLQKRTENILRFMEEKR